MFMKNNPKCKAVIFDLDGTLLNTIDDLADSVNAALKEMDLPPHSNEEYKMFIADIQRLRAHTLSEAEETLLASFGLITDTPVNVYNIFNNAEQPRVQISLSTGEKVELTSSAYTKYRSVSNRDDRKLIFSSRRSIS